MEPDPEKPLEPMFVLGHLFITPDARAVLRAAGMPAAALLLRHLFGDWGELDAHSWQQNDDALLTDSQLFSTYTLAIGKTVWVITEADRSSTTVLLPIDNQ